MIETKPCPESLHQLARRYGPLICEFFDFAFDATTPLVPRPPQGGPRQSNAAESHNVEIVRALVQKGANLAAVSTSGESALSYAIEHELAEIVRLLKEAG